MKDADAIVFVVDDDSSIREAIESLVKLAGRRDLWNRARTKTVTIKNDGSKKTGLTVSIESESAEPPVFTVKTECEKTLAPGKSCKVSVTFTPPDTTAQSGNLTIVDNVIGPPQSVALSGTGKAAKKK